MSKIKECKKIEYDVYGVKELLNKPDLTADEMASFKVRIQVKGKKKEDYMFFNDEEIQVEFMLRRLGYNPGEEKEIQRIKMLEDDGCYESIEFWRKAMK